MSALTEAVLRIEHRLEAIEKRLKFVEDDAVSLSDENNETIDALVAIEERLCKIEGRCSQPSRGTAGVSEGCGLWVYPDVPTWLLSPILGAGEVEGRDY